jgi:hypothetical protein
MPRRIGAAGADNQFPPGQNTVELAVGCLGHTHDSGRSRENKNTRFEQRRTAMHGKHSRFVFIPLYRNTVCYYGIDSRKCATGFSQNLQWIEMFLESMGCSKQGSYRETQLGLKALLWATHRE